MNRFVARALYTCAHVVYHFAVYLLFERLIIGALLVPLLKLLGLYSDPLAVRFAHAHDVVELEHGRVGCGAHESLRLHGAALRPAL